MDRILFYEKLSDETMAELDDFLSKHSGDVVSYWDWRTALDLDVKVLQELAASVKEYGERFDKILAKYKDKLHSENEIEIECARSQINRELEQIAVVPNLEVEKKLKVLCKKHY